MADDVEALKRELEVLRVQLQRERERGKSGDAACDDGAGGLTHSPECETSGPPSEPPLAKREARQRTRLTAQQESRVYVEHAPVDTRRGKWWLRDRRVLSQSAATTRESCTTLKVRETWLWSGRTLVLDKIVVLPSEQTSDREKEEQAKDTSMQDKQKDGKREDSDSAETCSGGLEAPAEVSPVNCADLSDESTVPTAEVTSDSEAKQPCDESIDIPLNGEESTSLVDWSPEEAGAPEAGAPEAVLKAEDEVRGCAPPSEMLPAQE